MFDFFKKSGTLDAKEIREAILLLVKEKLQQLDGGEGKSVQGISVFVAPEEEERFIYTAALYNGDVLRFREDVQRVADNYALDLPVNWQLSIDFEQDLPLGSLRSDAVKAGLKIVMQSAEEVADSAPKPALNAILKVLKGKAESEEYFLKAGEPKRLNIGRGSQIQANDGSIRVNHIAFPEDAAFDLNKYISRQHAHIQWDTASASFRLFADEGGVPPGNKTKIRTGNDESLHKLNSTLIGYPLGDNDQIILGDAAILQFTLDIN